MGLKTNLNKGRSYLLNLENCNCNRWMKCNLYLQVSSLQSSLPATGEAATPLPPFAARIGAQTIDSFKATVAQMITLGGDLIQSQRRVIVGREKMID